MRFKSYILMFLLLFAVTACVAKRPVVNPAPFEIPARFSAVSGGTPAVSDCCGIDKSEEWWKEFGDARLNQLMESAFKENLDIAMAYERVKQARAVMGVTRGPEGLQVNLAALQGQSEVFSVEAEKFSRSAAASYELDIWGKLSADTEAARKDMVATIYDLKALYISVSAELAEQYYEAVERNLLLEVARLMVLTAEDRFTLNERQYAEGLVSAQELFIAQEDVAVAGARVPPIEAQRANASHAVAILTGSLPKAEIAGLDTFQSMPPEVPPLLPSTLLTRRPDLQAALHRVEANNSRVGAAIADRFPSFSLTGDYGEASASLGSLIDITNVFWSLLVQVAMPVLDGGTRKAEVVRSEAVFNESLLEYRKTLLLAFQDVEAALEENRSAGTSFPLAVARVKAAEGALTVVTDEYRNGVGDFIDVLTGQQRKYEAQSGLISAKRALISARIGLVRSLGGGFMEERVLERAAISDKSAGSDR